MYSKIFMRNTIIRAIIAGRCNDETRNQFLLMKIMNELYKEKQIKSSTKISVYDDLVYNGILTKDDFIVGCKKQNIFLKKLVEGLNVTLSPTFYFHVEMIKYRLDIMINGKKAEETYIGLLQTEDIAMWIIQIKQNFHKYIQEWETTFCESAKKIKRNRMAFIAIKAMFQDAMKEYPEIKYEIIEQSRKTKIKVKIPNSNLEVCLDGWWNSYKNSLPKQIDELKALIDSHRMDATY